MSHKLDEEEVRVIDLVRVLNRRRRLFIASGLVFLCVFGLWLASMQSIFKSRAVLRIGRIAVIKVEPTISISLESVENIPLLVYRLQQQYWNGKKYPVGAFPRLQFIGSDWKGNDLLILEGYGRSPESARHYVSEVAKMIISEHDKQFKSLKETYNKQITMVRQNTFLSDDDVRIVSQSIRVLDRSRPTTLLVKPALDKNSYGRNLPTLIFMGVVFAICGAILVVFGRELVFRARK